MTTITVRMNAEEERAFKAYADLKGEALSTLLKRSLEEKMQDEFDIEAILDYERRLVAGETEYFSLEEAKKYLEI